MKRYHYALSFAVLATFPLMGCAHENASPKVPSVPEQPPIVKIDSPSQLHCFSTQPQDGFAQAGDVIADGTRWVWNEANHAWEVANSEETKQKLTDAYKSAKEYVNKALKE